MYDLLIIGGGINGAGIARDASGRGLKVVLIEKNSVGSATSSWSTKLIHGGLRYLENYDFKLVRESLKEREILYNIARNIVDPIPFIIPHTNEQRPAWIIKLGLFFYDQLAGKSKIPKSSSLNIQKKFPNILQKEFSKGFQYYDLQVDDKKLTELNILDAKKRGADIFENTNISIVKRLNDRWIVKFTNGKEIKSKIIINASGPWINEVNKNILNFNSYRKLRLVKGSHIILNKIYDQKIAFTLQNIDKRIVFVMPYKKRFTLIGTTEINIDSPDNPKIENFEIKYLLDSINKYLLKKINDDMIVSTYSGIRPLIEDYKSNTSNLSRDYIIDLDHSLNEACLINVYGGKITTYRKLSESAVNMLKNYFPHLKKPWTDNHIL